MVEWKKLGEIGKCMAGATPSTKESSYWDNGTIPWMSSGEVHQGVVKSTSALITQKGYDNSSTKMLPSGTVVIALAGQGKTRGTVAITAIELCTNQSLCGVVIDKDSIINKYVYYYLKTRYDDLRRISSGEGTRGGLNLEMIGSYLIPVPSLSEQERIVGILDTFTSSIENLKEQIAQRRKQYEYYRDQLLDLEGKEGVENKNLGDIVSFRNGKGHEKSISETGKYIVVNSKFISSTGEVIKYSNEQLCPLYVDDILMVMSDLPNGKALAKCFIVDSDDKYTLNQRIGAFHVLDQSILKSKYLYYKLNRNIQLLKFDNGIDQTNLRKGDILSILIPVPSISKQQRIVSILDTFEASIQNLEAQLAQREKQYEYYRNKLLTFE